MEASIKLIYARLSPNHHYLSKVGSQVLVFNLARETRDIPCFWDETGENMGSVPNYFINIDIIFTGV
jgi:hypothetical protein